MGRQERGEKPRNFFKDRTVRLAFLFCSQSSGQREEGHYSSHYSSKSGVLNPGTASVSDCIVLCGGLSCVPQDVPGRHLLDDRSSSPVMSIIKVTKSCRMSHGGQNHPWLRTSAPNTCHEKAQHGVALYQLLNVPHN